MSSKDKRFIPFNVSDWLCDPQNIMFSGYSSRSFALMWPQYEAVRPLPSCAEVQYEAVRSLPSGAEVQYVAVRSLPSSA